MARLITVFFLLAFSLLIAISNIPTATAVVNLQNIPFAPNQLQLCEDGNLYTVCPVPEAVAITDYRAVTTPLNPTGSGIRIDVGGGNNDHIDLSTLDTATLTPGSVVNIFYRAQPYRSKLLFFTDATEQNMITIHGVTDGSGNLPVIDCDGATTVNPERWSSLYSSPLGCWQLSRNWAQPWSTPANDGPSWYKFSHLDIRNTWQGVHTFDGGTAYQIGASPIRVSNGSHFIFEGMRLTNGDNGLFFASNFVIDHAEIRGSYFGNNGRSTTDRDRHHNVYMQVVSSNSNYKNIVEGNFFAPLRDGAEGLSGVKHRGTDFIFRYNTVICDQRCVDIVEAQDEVVPWLYANLNAAEITARYRTSYVYGNAFVIDSSRGWVSTGGAVHCGMDTTSAAADPQTFDAPGSLADGEPMARCHNGALYFYHNSIYNAFYNPIYRQSLIDLDSGGGGGEATYTGTAVIANNVWQVFSGGQEYLLYAVLSGTYNFQAANMINAQGIAGNTIYEEYSLNMSDANTIPLNNTPPSLTLTTTSGGAINFVDVANSTVTLIDLSLSPGSPAIGAALSLPPALATYPVQLQPNLGGGASLRNSTSNLGAFE